MSILKLIVAAGILSSAAAYAADIDLTAPAVIDDFNDAYGDAANQNALGAVYGAYSLGGANEGGGYWYIFTDKLGSSVKNTAGEAIDPTVANESSMVLDSTLHVTLSSKSTETYPYAGVGCNLVSDDEIPANIKYLDLTKMTSISMRVKGTGKVRMYFETKDFADATKQGLAGYDWGFYGKEITLTSSWTTFTATPAELLPEKDSPAQKASWTWDHGKTAVNKLAFKVKDNAEAEFQVDDIKFEGMTYGDFNFTSSSGVKSFKVAKGSNIFSVNASSISFKLAQAQNLTVSLNDVMGNQISSLYTGKTASETINLSDKNLARGCYLVVVSGKNVNYSQSIVVMK
jgi:hypothetical protein